MAALACSVVFVCLCVRVCCVVIEFRCLVENVYVYVRLFGGGFCFFFCYANCLVLKFPCLKLFFVGCFFMIHS